MQSSTIFYGLTAKPSCVWEEPYSRTLKIELQALALLYPLAGISKLGNSICGIHKAVFLFRISYLSTMLVVVTPDVIAHTYTKFFKL